MAATLTARRTGNPGLAAQLAAHLAGVKARMAKIAAADYRMTVTLLCDSRKVTLTVEPSRYGDAWEVSAISTYLMAVRTFDDLEEARACANGWYKHLQAHGYSRLG